ncbi:hypothetical protein [Nitrobacter sp.]|uniref:hypothetical protein n=1 Tax=Nitrobacter sp. TaxID=29420 RepID=UPI00399D67EF
MRQASARPLSEIGERYDPIANTGTVGRNFTHRTISDVTSFFDPAKFNFTCASGSPNSSPLQILESIVHDLGSIRSKIIVILGHSIFEKRNDNDENKK